MMMDYGTVPKIPSINAAQEGKLFLHSIRVSPVMRLPTNLILIHELYERLRSREAMNSFGPDWADWTDGLDEYFPAEISKLIRGYCGNIFIQLLQLLAKEAFKSSETGEYDGHVITKFYNLLTGDDALECKCLHWRLQEPNSTRGRCPFFRIKDLENYEDINFEPTLEEFKNGGFILKKARKDQVSYFGGAESGV